MKKTFLVLSLFLAVILTTSAKPITKEDPRVEQEFKKQFAGATNVKWSRIEGGYLSASFTWADRQTIAYFNSDAELVGCIRGLLFNQLPLSVMRSVEGHFQNPVVIEIREITNDEGVNYTIVLEYKNKTYKIRLNSLGDLLEKEKVKKVK